MHRRWMRLLGAMFAFTLLAAACGGEETPPPADGGTPSDGGGEPDLVIADFNFSPTELSVTEGQTITITNVGETSHSFTTDDEAVDETIDAGATVDIPLTGVTSGGFHCRFHSQMTGTITVG
jgi:plastocyanin